MNRKKGQWHPQLEVPTHVSFINKVCFSITIRSVPTAQAAAKDRAYKNTFKRPCARFANTGDTAKVLERTLET
jgi:hypothetical protein